MANMMEFKGGKELEKAFEDLGNPRDMRASGRRALRVAAKPMRDQARANVPTDTGITRKDIQVRNEKIGIAVSVGLSANKGGRAYIGRFHEFGTVHMKATPFLRPAVDENQGRFIEILKSELWAQIKKQLTKQGR